MRNAGLSNIGTTFCNYNYRKSLLLWYLFLNPSSVGAISYYVSPALPKVRSRSGRLSSNALEDVAPTELIVEIDRDKENDSRVSLLWSLVNLPILLIK